MEDSVRPLGLLAAALGVGFYRFWHVPVPAARCDVIDTRRADRSIVGPVALGVLATGSLLAGRVGTAVLLHRRVTAPFHTLPPAAQALVGVGCVAAVLAVGWWLLSAPARVRVTRDVCEGAVLRLPDDPPAGHEALHAAAAQLGHALLDPAPAPQRAEAFAVLREAAEVLVDGHAGAAGRDEHGVRRRCHVAAQRLQRRRQVLRQRDALTA
jgi:hypothetical protein